MTYQAFLESKLVSARDRGIVPTNLNPNLKPHASNIAAWALRGGSRAIFAAFGLAKTSIQLQILDSVLAQNPGSGLIVCPLGVKAEFIREAQARMFSFLPTYIRTNAEYQAAVEAGQRYFLTNYERIRDGALDPNQFTVVSLDEASVLRSFGSKTYQTFLTLFNDVPFKFVCTATPAPNRFKELIHYAGFLGIMDTGQALTRFFKRDPKRAGNLTIHLHKEKEFWLWVSTWATFLTKLSDLGYSDLGYDMPELRIIKHRLPVDHSTAGFDSWGQGKLIRDAAVSLRDASHEKRDSIGARIVCAKKIIQAGDINQHWVIWHDLEDERRALKKAIPEMIEVYGTQDLDIREKAIADFSDGRIRILGTKTSIAGSGTNLQRHCHSAIYLGINYKFNDFIQSIHRLLRFLQAHPVEIHLIYTESEDNVLEALFRKWEQYRGLVANMAGIIQEYGLANVRKEAQMRRSIGVDPQIVTSERFTLVNNDNVLQMENGSDNTVDLIVTSWPFSNHYEYTPTYNDFGHNQDDARFFDQMDYLTPNLIRVLKPGRLYCVHCKDRLLYGSVTGLGMYSVNPFSDKCVAHLQRHGLIYCGRITIVTDVVRENNQTYRLGWTEKCKDGTKMGVGSPEYVLLFRKLPSDQSKAYADDPVRKSKDAYTRSRWQFDASPFWRSSGDRFLSPEEIKELPQEALRAMWHEFNASHIYDYKQHVDIAEQLEKAGLLPASFMLLDPTAHGPWVWDDVVRMRTLNADQVRRQVEMHICPLQFDVVERLIETYSNPGELVLDPFMGIGTVPKIAIDLGRRAYGIELSPEYWADAVSYCRAAELQVTSPTLFDLIDQLPNGQEAEALT